MAKMPIPKTFWHGDLWQARIDTVNLAAKRRLVWSEFAGKVAEDCRNSRRGEGCNKTLPTVARLHV
jgi:hypothetical protein